MQRLPDAVAVAAAAWLKKEEFDGFTGFDAAGWDATCWILHAMYETATLPAGLSHDEVRRIEDAAGATEPVMVGDVDLTELLRTRP
jgi:hypothetical protein